MPFDMLFEGVVFKISIKHGKSSFWIQARIDARQRVPEFGLCNAQPIRSFSTVNCINHVHSSFLITAYQLSILLHSWLHQQHQFQYLAARGPS
jgi:hypothetical protein